MDSLHTRIHAARLAWARNHGSDQEPTLVRLGKLEQSELDALLSRLPMVRDERYKGSPETFMGLRVVRTPQATEVELGRLNLFPSMELGG